MLGVLDYGLYGVVSGVISVFSFLNGSLGAATSRYLTYELGLNNQRRLKAVFCTSFIIHSGLAIIVLFLGETLGLWAVNHLLTIPSDRLFACNIIYQVAVVSAFVSIIQVPFSAAIIAHEQMNVYAFIGIIEVLLKLGIAFSLTFFAFDKLILLGILNLTAILVIYAFYHLYCKRKIAEYNIGAKVEKKLTKEMLNFSGWSLFGNTVSMTRGQGINIIMNLFFGPLLNAASTISNQVSAAVSSFSNNFTVALNPQITKSYAANDTGQMKMLIFRGGKFSFFLLMLLSIPIFLETDIILKLWLKDVPEYAGIFVKLMVLFELTNCFTSTLSVAVQATGKIKYYQIFVGGVLLLTFPIAFVCYQLGANPQSAFIASIIISTMAIFVRLYFLSSYLGIKIYDYVKSVLCITSMVSACSIIPPYLLLKNMEYGWLRFMYVTLLSIVSAVLFIYLFI
jgi:O-antigen/teichoic acid export membrane protein